MSIHYLEIVTSDVDATCATYESAHGLSFGAAEPGLGNARTAALPDGCQIGIRAPLSEREGPVVRSYLRVADIAQAVDRAGDGGAVVALPPTELEGGHGTIAIFIQGGVEHGVWQTD